MEKFLLSLLCLLTVAFAGNSAETTDIISPETISDFKTKTSYTTWTNQAYNSNASYTFKVNRNYTKAEQYYGIQFGYNTSSSKGAYHSGFITTKSGGSSAKVTIVWASKGTEDRIMNIYESDNPFSGLDDLFADNIVASQTITSAKTGEISFETSKPYFGFRPAESAIEIASITIDWIEGGSAPVEETQCAKPVAKVGDKTLQHNDKVTVGDVLSLSCATEGTTIKYSLGLEGNNDELTEYTEPITLNKAEFLVLKATAVKEGLEDSEALEISFDVERKAAEVAFSRATAIAYLDALDSFTAPTLLNPNNLNVIYSSSNTEVADFDNTGNLTIKAAGETTITAKTAMTEIFEVGSASYTLIVNEKSPKFFTEVISYDTEFTQTDNSTSLYKAYEFTSDNDITYSGLFGINENQNLQFKSKDSSGLIISGNPNGYKLAKIEIKWASGTSNDREWDIYGDTEAYTAATELYATSGNTVKGELIGSFKYGTNQATVIEFEDAYPFVGMRSKSNALYISSLTFTWEKAVVAEPVKPEMPELEGDFVLTDNELRVDDSNVKSVRIKFNRKNTTHDIYYMLTEASAETNNGQNSDPESVNGGSVTTPLATRAAAEHDHGDFKKLEGDELEVNNTHSQLAYYVCDPETGVHSETKTLSLAVGSTAVAEVEMAEGEVKYFDLQGREVKGAPESGIYVRVKNGKSTKVLIK